MTNLEQPSSAQNFFSGPPVFAPVSFSFDLQRLRQHCFDHIFPLESVQQGVGFGGWSVLSANGSYKDGWQKGHVAFDMAERSDTMEHLNKLGLLDREFNVPTEICTGYMLELIQSITEKGFSPRRARVIRLTAGYSSALHRDYPPEHNFYRLHVPIITNEKCFFECERGIAHLPADGNALVIRVNQLHRVINNSTQDRYHLVMDAAVTPEIVELLA